MDSTLHLLGSKNQGINCRFNFNILKDQVRFSHDFHHPASQRSFIRPTTSPFLNLFCCQQHQTIAFLLSRISYIRKSQMCSRGCLLGPPPVYMSSPLNLGHLNSDTICVLQLQPIDRSDPFPSSVGRSLAMTGRAFGLEFCCKYQTDFCSQPSVHFLDEPLCCPSLAIASFIYG